jgi:LuxR family maltose regulon positive regulatory protein
MSAVAVTKLHPPQPRRGTIEREPLVRLLCAESDAPLTLISAPAGAGKTTLLASWHASREERRPFAWVSLDPADADPVRFWTLILDALGVVHPGFGAETRAAVRGAGHPHDVVVPLLINDAARLPGQTVLVLDDLHAVGSRELESSLAQLVERLPASLRLAVATRVDPALPLPRLRVRGELCEIRAADMRLSDAEAGALLRRRFGVELDAESLRRLQDRTEGWAAAVQLAGLALSRGSDPAAHEYLACEVIDAQDEATRRFLIETSVLDRLTASLCDAVTGGGDAARRLPELDRRNLLVVPLDPDRRWWRYHHLLAETLRTRLDPARAAELHRRALDWYRRNGMPEDAIHHALAAKEWARAADLIAEHWRDTFNRGELATVERWLDALPAQTEDGGLWLARLWVLMDRGRLVEAAGLLDLGQGAWGQLLRALHAFKDGDAGAAEDGAARASELDPQDPFWRTVAALVRGVAGYALGRPSAAAAFEEAEALASAGGNRLGRAYALGYRALIAAEAGAQAQATAHLDALEREQARDRGVAEHFVAFAGALAGATAAERDGRYEAAASELARAARLAARGAGVTERAQVQVALAQVQLARGRREEARALAGQARELLASARDPGAVAGRLERLERRLGSSRARTGELSESELAVLRLLPSALSNREIAEQLYVSVNTVKTHLRSIYAKLGAGSREQAVGRAREVGLLNHPG